MIGNKLSIFAGQKIIVRSYTLDVESAILGAQFIEILTAAHIEVFDRRMTESSSGVIALGVNIVGENQTLVESLLWSFRDIGGLSVSPEPPPAPMISQGGTGVYGAATIFVGVKPMQSTK